MKIKNSEKFMIHIAFGQHGFFFEVDETDKEYINHLRMKYQKFIDRMDGIDIDEIGDFVSMQMISFR
ncbi:MAG: hypothetical protein HQM14_18220 [SAR324 cluster bacterium]|nr:hypothetical protein [SAR324 cluster bacterium]